MYQIDGKISAIFNLGLFFSSLTVFVLPAIQNALHKASRCFFQFERKLRAAVTIDAYGNREVYFRYLISNALCRGKYITEADRCVRSVYREDMIERIARQCFAKLRYSK